MSLLENLRIRADSMAKFKEWISSNPLGGIIELEGIKIKVTPKIKKQ